MSKTIEYTQAEREKYKMVTELLGLEGLDVVGQSYDRESQTHELYCVARWDVALCPKCLQLSESVHDYPKRRRIHDAPLRGEKVILLFDSRRFDCAHCKKAFTQEIADVASDCTYTHRLYEEITNPKRKQDVATLAELYGIGYKIVERMLLKAGESKLADRRKAALQVTRLGIDEIAQKKATAILSSS
jgi:transposase